MRVINDLGNPLEEESNDLIVLDIKVVADRDVTRRMQQIEGLGKTQRDTYITERLIERMKTITNLI